MWSSLIVYSHCPILQGAALGQVCIVAILFQLEITALFEFLGLKARLNFPAGRFFLLQ